VEAIKRGQYKITESGKNVALNDRPESIDIKY
jgi:hypothetical protein